ncbi:rhodanese-like domain-containing protein [Streptomyces sp. NPDC055078]
MESPRKPRKPRKPRNTVDSAGLAALLASGAPPALLDVRERGEYVRGHIPGATTLARGLLDICAGDVLPGLTTPTVLYCDDGERSRRAADTMTRLGYRDVTVVRGGFTAWRAAGGACESGANVPGKAYGERLAVECGLPEVEPAEAEALISAGTALVIDVRDAKEYASGHLPGAVHVPGGELPVTVAGLRAAGALPDTVIVHCAGRTRGLLAVDALHRLGVRGASALRNGTMSWLMSGRELETGPGDGGPEPTAAGRDFTARHAHRLVREARIQPMSPQDIARARADGACVYVVDVRLPEEYAAGRLDGALSIPGGQLANTADEYIGHRRAAVVCYSGHQVRARIAAELLRRIGYPNATWLTIGFDAYRAAGLPTGSGVPRWAGRAVPGLGEARALIPAATWRSLAGPGAPLVVDVRRSSEFAVGHLPGSVWVPRGDLERRMPGVGPDRQAPLVVVSNRDIRSALAARTLRDLGYTRVRRLAGGLRGSAAGHHLVEGLDGAEVSLREAKEDVNLTGERGEILRPDHTDMRRYLDWELRLGRHTRR